MVRKFICNIFFHPNRKYASTCGSFLLFEIICSLNTPIKGYKPIPCASIVFVIKTVNLLKPSYLIYSICTL